MALITSSLCTHLKEYWDGNEHWGDGWKSIAQGSKSTPQERTFMSSSTCWWRNSSINHNMRHTCNDWEDEGSSHGKTAKYSAEWAAAGCGKYFSGRPINYYSLWVPNTRDATCQMLQEGRPKFLDSEIRLTKIHAFRKEEAVSNIIKLKLQSNQFYARHWIRTLAALKFSHYERWNALFAFCIVVSTNFGRIRKRIVQYCQEEA